MATPDGLVREACALLAGYMDHLEELVAEPDTGTADTGTYSYASTRLAETPEPWNAMVGRALMDPWEGIPRLEAAIQYANTGHPGMRRGGSTGNVMAALDAIPKLAAGLDEDGEAAVLRIVERWINAARSVPAIDEAQRWRPLRSRACPFCGCWFLRVLLDAAMKPTRHIECQAVGCEDSNGLRPVATMDDSGLHWADGTDETMPDLDG